MELENFRVLVGVESGNMESQDMVLFHAGNVGFPNLLNFSYQNRCGKNICENEKLSNLVRRQRSTLIMFCRLLIPNQKIDGF